ncbi:MAG: GlsB/YeaQ/YmgE family stress response membrane protein [Spirochaetota bacterium]|nr:GlsB/YeaQ/YmgE family stress response membrane protein [Spirochaetota bacterium]
MEQTISILIYLAIGALMGTIFYFVMRKIFLGKIYGAIITGILGAILGANFLGEPVRFINSFFNKYNVEIFPTIVGSILVIWIFKAISAGINHQK